MADVQSCPDVSQLERLLEGLLAEQEQAALDQHLQDCAGCQQRLDELIAAEQFWSDIARHLKSAHCEIEAGTATRLAARHGEGLNQGDDDLTLEFLAPSDKPGSLGRLEHYEVLEVIGRGGMGIVLRAFDEKLHRVVAIKVMAPRLAATSPPRKRFLREARAAAQVRHEHVVDIHAVEEQPIPHLVMEYVPGESLQQRLNRIGPLEVPDVLRIGQQIARGLAAAHAQGLIHRDVKPGNILLEKGIEERVKITDFGLARAADDASLTQSGVIAGTPQYMAPEQAKGEAVDHRADLFSLGSVLYAMASGRPPFRAPTSLAVLKRVVDDTPRPIGEIIPEVPQWLCDIIARLHAKRPEDRFQTAREVADLLARCPVAITVPVTSPADDDPLIKPNAPAPNCQTKGHVAPTHLAGSPETATWRPWLIAACALLLLLCILSLSEATGVTHVAATAIRLLTPHGTLVVETSDPGVKVTIEGDGGLIVTGAGLEEIRLRPGSYQLRADKNGQQIPLDQQLVTITRGDKQIVRVRMESTAPAAAAVSRGERNAFVVLDSKGTEIRKCDTLAEAVLPASNGDIIEIRGNGPFVTPPISLGNRALTLRAAPGFCPVVRLNQEGTAAGIPLLTTDASLVLEGLELEVTSNVGKPGDRILARGSSLSAANCRFDWPPSHNITTMSRTCRFRNCQIVSAHGMYWGYPNDGDFVVDNCVQAGGGLLQLPHRPLAKTASPQIRVVHSTVRAKAVVTMYVPGAMPAEADAGARIRLAVSESVIDVKDVLNLGSNRISNAELGQHAEKIDSVLPQLLTWSDRQNLYAQDDLENLVTLWSASEVIRPPSLRTLADWDKTWGQSETRSSTGRVRYEGGDPLEGQVSPEGFRLRADSAGYRAGPDGKDLGADVDLVGPGAAYERWKKTPEYQEWLKETKQVSGQ